MTLETLAILILMLPLGAALLNGTVGYLIKENAVRDQLAMGTTSVAVSLAALASIIVFYQIGFNGAAPMDIHLMSWMATSAFDVSFGLLVDKLTATMLLVVTVVSACVHVYSIGYMQEDKSRARFFTYLSLFTVAMLLLVTAPNLIQMFLGWEGVGVASYLLIGFWHHKESANAAAMKAFIVNRVADAAMLVGIFTVLMTFGSLTYADILPRAGEFTDQAITFLGMQWSVIDLIALLLFIGAMGKSAQIGLHTWLPDAMEGPTPVSALIHAATMVTAGVFLMCRMSPLLEYADTILPIIGWVGAITALFAATVGLVQKDIKRVIAYSTCSQLGYMFFAIGVSAYPAAMFHLTTHAFFKALLFLGAGSVIHALHHEQNLFKMGGVRALLPVTYGLMWIGSLALAGIPPFAGFFSKDLVLESAFGAHSGTGYMLYAFGSLAAFMTAFYSFRVLFMAFHGKFKGDASHLRHAHEAPWSMRAPMLLLGVGAVLSGLALSKMGYLDWWQGSLVILEDVHHALHNAHHTPFMAKYFPLLLALGGIALAVLLYLKRPQWPAKLAGEVDLLYSFFLNKWWFDELYDAVLVRPIRKLGTLCWQWGDVKIIDGLGPNGVAALTMQIGQRLRGVQTGYVYHYAFVFIAAIVVLLLWKMLG